MQSHLEPVVTLAEATATLARLDAARDAFRRYEAATLAHAASKPTAPTVERPTPPTAERPTSQAVADARAALSAAERAAGERAAAERALTAALADEATTARKATETATEAARVARYVGVLRAAPSEMLRGQLAALPEMPHVRVTVPDDGDRIVIEGQNTHGAWVDALTLSSGERVRAGAELRHAIRVAADKRVGGWIGVPLPVDDRGQWSGALDIPGPVVELVTVSA